MPKRREISNDKALKAIGLSKDAFDFYSRQFASNRKPFIYRTKSGWKFNDKWALKDEQIASHLAEKNFCGVTSGPETDYVVIDVDWKDKSKVGKTDFHKRFESIFELFPAAVPIQSSSSGGIHIYNFFDSPEPLEDVLRFTRNRLKNAGLKVEPGRFEIFPRERIGFRLPFGQESYIVDPDTLLRAHGSKAEDIFYIRYNANRLLIDEVYEVREMAPLTGEMDGITLQDSVIDRLNHISASVRISTNSNLKVKCEFYLEHGLESFGTRYRVSSMLICYALFHLRRDPEQTYEFVEKWLVEKNNGLSNDWNKNPEAVLKILRAQIRSYVKNGTKRFHGLSRNEIGLILIESLSYEEQAFLFDLLSFLKTRGNPKNCAHISKSFFCRFNGSSNRTYLKRIDLAYLLGILRKKHGHFQLKSSGVGLPSLFEHFVQFDYEHEEFFSIDQAIVTLRTPDEIRERYSDYRARRLLKTQRRLINGTAA